jgi:hypothetical protein
MWRWVILATGLALAAGAAGGISWAYSTGRLQAWGDPWVRDCQQMARHHLSLPATAPFTDIRSRPAGDAPRHVVILRAPAPAGSGERPTRVECAFHTAERRALRFKVNARTWEGDAARAIQSAAGEG